MSVSVCVYEVRHTYTHLYSTKNREKESEALAQDDFTG